jgi:hypothetical protein
MEKSDVAPDQRVVALMPTSFRTSIRNGSSTSLYDHVAGRLNTILPMFGLERCSANILRAYEIIFEDSLRLPLGAALPQSSRLNYDGTPIQFALSLGPDTVPLQFLGEAGRPNLSDVERVKVSRRSISLLSGLLQVEKELELVSELIDMSCRVNSLDLNPDHGGTFWIGVGFSSKGKAALKLYINGKRGAENENWSRFERFIDYFGASKNWRDTKKLLDSKMKPLGMAITLAKDSAPRGRLYLSGYGNLASYYEGLLEYCEAKSVADAFSQFTAFMLKDDRKYPTQSAVFSIAAVDGKLADAKIDFCGHCLFRSDSHAFDTCLQWLHFRKVDPHLYSGLLNVLSEQIDQNVPNVHVYVGLGWKQQREHTTIYLKPDLRH